jgi:hypothetical protein
VTVTWYNRSDIRKGWIRHESQRDLSLLKYSFSIHKKQIFWMELSLFGIKKTINLTWYFNFYTIYKFGARNTPQYVKSVTWRRRFAFLFTLPISGWPLTGAAYTTFSKSVDRSIKIVKLGQLGYRCHAHSVNGRSKGQMFFKILMGMHYIQLNYELKWNLFGFKILNVTRHQLAQLSCIYSLFNTVWISNPLAPDLLNISINFFPIRMRKKIISRISRNI